MSKGRREVGEKVSSDDDLLTTWYVLSCPLYHPNEMAHTLTPHALGVASLLVRLACVSEIFRSSIGLSLPLFPLSSLLLSSFSFQRIQDAHRSGSVPVSTSPIIQMVS
jgi:hypothetical protein